MPTQSEREIDIQRANALIEELELLLSRHLPPTMTDEERQKTPTPQSAFSKAVQSLAGAARAHPELAAAANFVPGDVLDALDRVRAFAPVRLRLDALCTRLSDAALRWNADAFIPATTLYNMAKSGMRRDGSLWALVEPMAEMFGRGRKRKPKK